jgi:hypothetical protein
MVEKVHKNSRKRRFLEVFQTLFFVPGDHYKLDKDCILEQSDGLLP